MAAVLWRTPDPSVDEEERIEAVERAHDNSSARAVQPGSFRQTITSGTFLRVIPATAPWVFGVATMSFAVVPGSVHVPGFDAATAGIVTGLTMGAGVAIQPLAQRIEQQRPGRALPVGLALAALGMLLAARTFATRAPILLVPLAIVFGAAYGVILVAGLRHIETLGHPKDRARLNAAFYALTYIGFAQPLTFTISTGTVASEVIYALIGTLIASITAVGMFASQKGRRGSR